MSATLRTLGASATFLLALSACSGGDPAGPTTGELAVTTDFAVLAANSAAEDIEMMGGPSGALGLGLFGLAVPGPHGPFAARDLGCRSLQRPGLEVTRTCTFTDAAGAPQDAYDPATTDSVRIQTAVNGERSHERWSASISRSSDLTVTGLAGAETQRTWNGTGEESVSRSQHGDGSAARGYTLETTFTINEVVVPVPGGPGKWPLSGSITRTATGEITSGPRAGQGFSRTATITFNGTGQVTMTVGTETFTVDLSARRAARRP